MTLTSSAAAAAPKERPGDLADEDFGRLDISWLYPPHGDPEPGVVQPRRSSEDQGVEEDLLVLGLAVS
jgi:hypothetical protein